MIKGKTLIELTDVNTGKVERFEDENIITNAGQLYASLTLLHHAFYGKINSISNKYSSDFPIYNMVYGGIKLFEKTIEESVSNYNLPNFGTNAVIGYASSDTSDGTDTRRGSRNLEETTILDNGVQIVWDFATSEANGNISCVCLTSELGGKSIIWNPAWKLLISGYTGSPVSFDKETMILTTVSYSGTITVSKYKIEANLLSLDTTPFKCKLIETQEGSTSSSYIWRDSGENYYYYISSLSSSEVKISKLDKTTLAITTETVSLNNLSLKKLNNYKTNHAIYNGFMYLAASTNDKIYKVDLSNPSNITEISTPTWGTYDDYYNHITPYGNDMILANGILIDCNTGDYEVIDSNYNVYNGTYYRFGSGQPIYGIFQGDGFSLCCYQSVLSLGIELSHEMLMSINNLDTPVTKTADKTMKITYTLTYTE